jgi:hypothetical protein
LSSLRDTAALVIIVLFGSLHGGLYSLISLRDTAALVMVSGAVESVCWIVHALSTNPAVHTYIYTSIYTHLYLPTHIYTTISTHPYIHTYIYIYIYTSIYTCPYIHLHQYTRIYIYTYTPIYIHPYIHTRIYTPIYTHPYVLKFSCRVSYVRLQRHSRSVCLSFFTFSTVRYWCNAICCYIHSKT